MAAVLGGLGALGALDGVAVLGGLGAVTKLDDVAAWHLVGGLGSAVYITAGILLFPRLGAVVAVGLFIAGQMLASLVLDATGGLGVPRAEITPAPWWGWLGGLCGAASVTSVFLLMPEIGVGLIQVA